MRQTVLHVTQAIGDVDQTVGGVAVVMLDQVSQLVSTGGSVVVAGPDRGGLPEAVRSRGADFVRWDAAREPGPSVAGEARQLGRIVADVDPDVVQLHSSKAGLAGRIAVRGRRPTVFMPHAWSFRHGDSAALRRSVLSWERFAARWTDVILCVSDAEREAGIEARVRARYEVISNTSDWDPAPMDRSAARVALLPDLPVTAPIALCIGRLTRQKGQDVLLRAWPAVRSHVPEARLVVVGSGPDAQLVARLASPDVVLVPAVPRDEVPRWLAAADVVVFPSRWEGQSIGVMEALQTGRPVVATDCEGMAEAIAGGRGALVPVDDEPALTRALVPYLADRAWAAAEGDLARGRYEQVHGAIRRANIERYVALIDELAHHGAASRAS